MEAEFRLSERRQLIGEFVQSEGKREETDFDRLMSAWFVVTGGLSGKKIIIQQFVERFFFA